MILSYKSGFIFLKAIKTASTSIEIVLSKYCGPDDVITELPDPDETIRQSLGYRGPQNNINPVGRQLLGRLKREDKSARRFKYHHNIAARSLRAKIGAEVWGKMLTMSISRNPFDRAISKFYHDHRDFQWDNRRGGTDYSPDVISEYIVRLPDTDLTNWHTYADGDELIVSRMLRYEKLGFDLQAVLAELGIHDQIELPNAKGNFRLNREHYSNILNMDARRRIEAAAAMELKHFGYRWSED